MQSMWSNDHYGAMSSEIDIYRERETRIRRILRSSLPEIEKVKQIKDILHEKA